MASTSRPLALVTGGSSGIGFELARQFVRNGHDVVINGQDDAKLQQAAARLREASGARVETVAADLATSDGVERLYRAVQDLGRPVDVLCANAGVGVGGGDFTQTDLEAELRLVDLNVRSQVHLTKLVVRDMVERGRGKILITSSISGLMPGPFETVYSASKMFMRSFGEALRNELAEKGIGVTVLMPGPTDTAFFHRAGMDDTSVGQGKKDDPAEVARQGYEALMRGRHHVVAASMKTKAQAAATNLMSDPMLAGVHRKMSEPRSGRSGHPVGQVPPSSRAVVVAGVALGALAAATAASWFRLKRREQPVEARTRKRLRSRADDTATQAGEQ